MSVSKVQLDVPAKDARQEDLTPHALAVFARATGASVEVVSVEVKFLADSDGNYWKQSIEGAPLDASLSGGLKSRLTTLIANPASTNREFLEILFDVLLSRPLVKA